MKPCNKCKQEFPLSEFYSWEVETKTKGMVTRHRYICKECDRSAKRSRDKRTTSDRSAKHLMDKYGITPKEKETLLRLQGNKCAICPRTEPGGRYNVFHVDHCHETGKVRGLLCDRCNRAIGLLQDNSQLCINASQYLERSKPLG